MTFLWLFVVAVTFTLGLVFSHFTERPRVIVLLGVLVPLAVLHVRAVPHYVNLAATVSGLVLVVLIVFDK